MGTFLQYALFPGCDEASARAAVETAAKDSAFCIDPETCRYARTGEGTQVLMDGCSLGFAPLAKALSEAAANPVMLLYIYDGDYWGYDFYGGNEEDHFNTLPDYFGPVSQEEKQRLAGNPAALAGWFPIGDGRVIWPYFVHWSDEEDELEEAGSAYPDDRCPYGDCWQMLDFAARLGFPWPFDEVEDVPPPPPPQPTLGEILKQNLPPLPMDAAEDDSLLCKLPSALSPDYIQRLLEEDGVRTFGFEDKRPQEIVDAVNTHRWSVSRPERDPLCQRLAVLGAFCAFWQSQGNAWGFLDHATYEPVYGSYASVKPTDIYVLRARAALTEFTKRHRALRDLKRLIELDPANSALYQAEIKRWKTREQTWQERVRQK